MKDFWALLGKIFVGTCIALLFQEPAFAQIPASLNPGEAVTFDVYFKWGLIMPRAGEATISFKRNNSVPKASYQYRLLFKTAKFFDNFFSMRDTLSGYYSDKSQLIYSDKRTNDGDYYSVDELFFSYKDNATTVHSRRYTLSRVKIDTTMTAEGFVTDLLGAFYFLRSVDRKTLNSGDVFDATTAIGRDLVKIRYIYQNQSIIERGNFKYNTRYFKIDIHDDAFENVTTAAEVWVSDDDNFIPIKIRTKLKVGYAEIYYKSSSALAHPFSSRIEMK